MRPSTESRIVRRGSIGLVAVLLGACATAPEKPEPETISEETRAAYQDALALMQEEAYEEAIATLRTVSERNDTLAGPYVNIGIAYRELGEAEQAREAFQAAIERDASNGPAYNQLGLLHRKAGRFQEARDTYSEGIDENPEYARLYRNLGILCDIYLQDLQCALENFRAYQERTEDNDEQIKRWIADVERRAQ